MNKHDVLIVLHEQQLWCPEGAEQWRLLNAQDVSNFQLNIDQCIEVGVYQQGRCYVVKYHTEDTAENVMHFRALIGVVDIDVAALINRAMQLITWQEQHQYCGRCGRLTTQHQDELAFICKPCSLSFYPKIMPCIMCLIVKGEYCLLAHHARHKEGVYATLAGFVEAGESLEAAVIREVEEEVGLTVGKLSYFQSQAWPFPQQLMIGFFAEFQRGEISEDGVEILDAEWFHYTQLPNIPSVHSLSGLMIAEFVRRCEQCH